jgi:RecA-family ATPase
VHSFADDDPIVCKDYVREKAKLQSFKPNGGERRRISDDVIANMVMAAAQGQSAKPSGKLVASYDYTDVSGTLLFQVLRFEPKTFSQRRPDGHGGWINSLGDVKRVLYRWPELLKYPDATVFVTEGEKDADRIAALGHCATTVAAGKWTDDCIQALAGRDVIILQDNDEPGRKKARTAAEALYGVVKTVRVVALPDLAEGEDVSNWLDLSRRNDSDKLIEICFDTPRWESIAATLAASATERPSPAAKSSSPGFSDMPNDSDGDGDNNEPIIIKPIAAKPAPSRLPPLQWLDMSNWDDGPRPEREWAIPDRVPLNQVGLFSGEGGAGKSIIEMTKDVAHVAGKDWLGSLPAIGPAIYLGAEDEEREIHIRFYHIASHYGVTFSELIAGGLHVLCKLGQDATLCALTRSGRVEATALYKQLYEAAGDIKPKNISIDTLSRAFAGNEIDRVQVYAFAMHMQALAMVAHGSVTVLSHPSLQGIASGSGLSGSTAWQGAFRFRQYLKGATTDDDGEPPDSDLREIAFLKNQYGPCGDTITLRYQRGLFLPVATMGSLEKLAEEQRADNLFLELLDKFQSQGRNVSHFKNANSYAPTAFSKDPKAKAPGVRKALADAMERLFTAKKIKVEDYGKPSNPHHGIIRCHDGDEG